MESSLAVEAQYLQVYKHVHFGPNHQFGSYYLNGSKINSIESQKDLGILFDHQLKFHLYLDLHTTDVLLQKLIVYWDWSEIFRLSRSRYVCWSNYLLLLSVLLCNTANWYEGHYLFLIKGKSKRFNVELQDYHHHLEINLMGRDSRLRGDMILLYKILNYFSSEFSTLYTYSITTTTMQGTLI